MKKAKSEDMVSQARGCRSIGRTSCFWGWGREYSKARGQGKKETKAVQRELRFQRENKQCEASKGRESMKAAVR